MKNKATLLLAVLVSICLFGIMALGQTINGSISGSVVDTQGAVVPGATVTATNAANGFTRTVTTDSDGNFKIESLPVATYTVTVEKRGFKKSVNASVTSNAGSDTGLRFALETGAVTAVVEVTSAGEILDTTEGQVSKTVTQTQILELPGRNSLNGLALLNPGVVPNQNGRPGSGFAVNGNRTRSNNFTIDGANNNDQSLSIPRQNLPPEALEEFNIITNTPKAEFGRNAGSYVNQITRSGTNHFHGTGHYAWDGNGMDALTTSEQRSFNANKLANPTLSDKTILRRVRPVTNDTIWGGTIGGPIKQNHTFFFFSYDDNPFRTTIGSATRAAIDAPTRAFLVANRLNFANTSAVDFILANYPVANDPTVNGTAPINNAAGTQIGTANFTTFNRFLGQGIPYGRDFHRVLGKVNTRINSHDQLSFRYLWSKQIDPGQPTSLPGQELGQLVRDDSFTVNDAYMINSSWINEARFTYSIRKIDFPENYSAFANGTAISVGSTFGAFTAGSVNFPQNREDHVLEFTENIVHTTGNHTLKFGYNLLHYDLNSVFAPNSRGTAGFANLSAFLNDVSNNTANANGVFGLRPITLEHSVFGQDDWRVNPDLTVNLGIRYEYVTTPYGYFSNTKPDTNNFGPRLGFAWNPKDHFGGKFVMRAGFGISYDQVFQNILLNVARNYPRVVNNTLTNCVGCHAYLGFANIPLNATTTTPLPPQGVTTVRDFFGRTPANFPAALAAVLDYRYYGLNERAKSPMSTQWTYSLQYQLGNDYVVKAEYIGTRGSNLVREIETNYGFAAPLGNGLRLDPTKGSIVNGQGLANSRYHAGQFTLEKRLSAMNWFGKNWGRSTFNMNYTWSSFISESDDVLGGQTNRTIPSDPRDPHADRGRSGFDQPHRFVFSGVWGFPDRVTGNGFADRFLGGWEISQVTTFASGIPFTLYNANNAAGITSSQISTVFLSQHLGVNPGGTPGTFTTATCVNLNCTFTNPNAQYIIYPANSGIFGSLGANTERTPSTYRTDAAFVKNIRTVGETQRLQLRLEVFNLFNRRNFIVIPTNTFGSVPSAGTFLNYGLQTNVIGRQFLFGARYFF